MDREFLRHLIDTVWNHVYENKSVPATQVADDLIDEAIASQIEDMKTSTNSKMGSAHWYNTLLGRILRIGESLEKNMIPSEEILKSWGKQIYDSSQELVDGFEAINATEKKPDVIIDGGYVNPSTLAEDNTRLGKIRKLDFANLKALKKQCEEMMNHQQRRFPKPRNSNPELYKEQYEIWIEWFSLFNVVVLVMDEYLDKLKG